MSGRPYNMEQFSYRKSQKHVMEELLKTKNLTPEGKEWLTLALDPFHDYQHQIAGYPDADASGTVVSCYNMSYEIKKPVATAGNWDCHIYSLPFAAEQNFSLCTEDAGELTGVSELNGKLGLVNMARADAGQDTFPGVAPFVSTNFITTPIATFNEVVKGVTRVVGMGMEVVNTTADIHKQGSVTVYRMPQGNCDSEYVFEIKDDEIKGVASRFRAPPTNINQAVSMLNSRTWEAEKGVYQVIPFSTVDNPMLNLGYKSVLIQNGFGTGPGSATVISAQTPTTQGKWIGSPQQTIPINTAGMYFTGLSEQTTLRLKVKIYVERAPTPEEPDLVVLATPSAGYDIKALQLYARAINTLAVAVPVGDNASGDWWKSVLDVVAIAAPVIGMIATPTFPAAPLIAASVAAAAKSASLAANTAQRSKRNSRQSQQQSQQGIAPSTTAAPRRRKNTTSDKPK